VVLEATGGALAIARILEPHVGRVVMANPMAVRAIATAKAKTDRLDARTLAKLLAAGFLPGVWIGDERTRLLRRLASRHAHLVRQRTRAKNQIHAVLQRTLKGRPPASDLFGKRGRAWLDNQDLPADERETVQAALRHVEFLDGELRLVDRSIARQVLAWPEVRRIMTIPGMGAMAAAGVMAAIADISRFPTSRHLVGYLGLDARVRQSGSAPARRARGRSQGGEGLPPVREGLQSDGKKGCGCRHRGAHLFGPRRASSAAGTSPRPCSLARGHPHPRVIVATRR
jgi:transposase